MKFEGGKMTLKPAGHAIAFHEEVRRRRRRRRTVPILVSQNFYRNGDRFTGTRTANGSTSS